MTEQLEPDFRDIERRHDEAPDEPYPYDSEPAECEHGYTEGCPDCDSSSHLPAVLP
jgi:hypothetical protein